MEHDGRLTEVLLAHYSDETCSHIEASVSIFFGLIGLLIILDFTHSAAARIVLSVMYFALGALGAYYFVRLFYYRRLLEHALSCEPYLSHHIQLQERVFRESRLIRC
jgi:hypothetical protein